MAHLRPWIPRLRGRDPCRHGVRIVPPGIQWRRPWPWAIPFDHSKPTTCPSHGAAHPGCGMALDGGGMPLVPWSLSLFPSVPASPSPGSLHPSAQVLAIKRAHLCRLLSPSPWPWRRSMVGPRRRRRRERWEPTRMDANRTHPIRAGSIASSGPAGRVPPSWTRRSCLHGDVARAQSFRPRACLDDTDPSKPHLGAHPPRTCARARPSCFQEQPSSFFPPCQAEESDSKPCARREVPTKVEFQVPPRAPRDRCLRRSEARLESSSPSTRGDGPRPPGARHALHVAAAEGTWTQERGTWTGRTAGETPGRSET